MLLEGLYLEIKISLDSYRVCKLTFVEKLGHYIDVGFVEYSKNCRINVSKIFIIHISAIEMDADKDTLFHIECDGGSDFVFKTPDAVDTETMIAGLQVIQMNSRQMYTRSLKRGFSVIIAYNNYFLLDSAFCKWKQNFLV